VNQPEVEGQAEDDDDSQRAPATLQTLFFHIIFLLWAETKKPSRPNEASQRRARNARPASAASRQRQAEAGGAEG